MANYPFIYNYRTGRGYYGPSLTNAQPSEQMWMTGASEDFYEASNPTSNLIWAGGIAAGVFAAGFIPTSTGRVWDYYLKGIRGVEEYSPAQIFRTFQLSNFFSQFETATRQTLNLSTTLLKKNQPYSEYLASLIGPITRGGKELDALAEIQTRGLKLEKGRLLWGDTGEVALKYAGAIRAPEGARQYWGSAYARVVGAGRYFDRAGTDFRPPAHIFFSEVRPLPGQPARTPLMGGMPAQIIGAQTRWQYGYRQAAAWGTEWVSRFNRLLKAPFEMEPMRTVFGRIEPYLTKVPGFKYGFAVGEDTGLKMLGKLSAKYGLGIGALALAYQTVDWATRKADILDETVFSEGVTAGMATLGVKANLMASQVAETLGLHRYREAQEEIAPGSTSLTKLAAFPIMGGMAAMLASYGVKTAKMARLQWQGIEAPVARKMAEEAMSQFSERGFVGAIKTALTSPTRGLYARQDWAGRLVRKIATRSGDELKYAFLGKIGPTKLAAALGVAAGAALILPFLPGALIPSERPEELRKVYSGEKEIAVRRGRWWEFGRSPYEGQRIAYYRPHWYPRMLMRARDKSIWGEDEPSPLEKLWKREATYELERKFYEERPYPVTGLPFEDIPLIGPILAHTIGKIIKPPRLMHTEEWLGPGGEQIAEPPRFGGRVATEIGETAGGVAESPYGLKGLVGEQAYRMTEMIGLPGFAMVSMKEKLTGTGDLFDQIKQLESSRRIAGFERWYWDQELGGLMGMTEAFRRLYPHRRRQIPLYNPIRNLMPEWLPGPGEKSPDFWHGDPYTKVPEGELRLPGRGYEARYQELEDVRPEDYPLIHKYKILADVAPYSDKFKAHRQMVRAARKSDSWGEYEEEIYRVTEEQVAAKKKRLEFQEYKYLAPMGEKKWGGEDQSSLIATLNRVHSEQEEGEKGGAFSRVFGGYWEALAHNAETAWDQLTPVSPGAKLVHIRNAVESYERMQLYGTESAFWQHPWRHFFRPFTYLFARGFGFKGIPDHIKDRRSIEEYFDTLEYIKYSRLSNVARMSGDSEAVKEFEAKKDQTLFGINPFTRNYSSIFRALPRRERDYFNAFAEAETTEERAKILEMVPDNEKALYLARWKLQFADDVKKARKAGILSEEQIEEADEIVDKIYDEARTEGFPTSDALFAEYVQTRLPGESYGDWYRRTKLLPDLPNVPGPDWVGWHPSVDLEDIKLKLVQNMGEDMHDYDLWPSQAQQMVNKPFINDEAVQAITGDEGLTDDEMRDRINELFLANDMRPDIFTRTAYAGDSSVSVDIEQDEDIDSLVEELSK